MGSDKTSKRGAFLINLMYIVAVASLVVLFIRYAVGWLMPFIIGFAVAMAFAPLIRVTAAKFKLNRRLVACVVVVIGYAVLITLVTVCTIQLISFLGELFTKLPALFETQVLPLINNVGGSFSDFIDNLPREWLTAIESIQASLMSWLQSAIMSISAGGVTFVTNFVKGLPGFLVALVFTILASFFISVNYDKTVGFMMAQLNDRGREIAGAVKNALMDTIFKWLKACLLLMLITFAELSIGLAILGFQNAILIAAAIALFDFLPVFGTGGIVIPWILISFITGNTVQGVGLLVLYGIITVVRNFIEPKIVSDQLGMNPIVSLVSIYLGLMWFGVFGMIFMPISVQIVLSLHNKGVITLYKRTEI